METFRHILDLPDPRETLPRSSTTVLGLDDEESQQELRRRSPSAMPPLNPILKDAFEKFETDFLASNLPEGAPLHLSAVGFSPLSHCLANFLFILSLGPG